MATKVNCPQCGAKIEWNEKALWRPFCSERCKMIDLGAWASDAYRVSGVANDDDESLSDEPAQPPPKSQ
jgi:uncharacterized protein